MPIIVQKPAGNSSAAGLAASDRAQIFDAPSIAATQPPDDMEDLITQRMAFLLRGIFPTFTAEDLRAVAAACTWFSVPGQTCLFSQGDESDSIYIVTSGILGAYRIAGAGREHLLGRIGAGEIVGEMGFIAGDPRMATIRALRNCELLRISKDELRRVAVRYPMVLIKLCGTVVRRLRDAQEGRGPVPLRPRTICLVPHDAGIDTRAFAECIVAASDSACLPLVLSKREAGNTTEWFFRREQNHGLVVYLAEPDADAWTRFCLRQADCVVLVARGTSEARPFAALGASHSALPPDIPIDLILQWERNITLERTAAWLALIKPRAHYHVRSASDGERAARLITGHSVGLVLSGGGARGLAHVGVARALQEYGMRVDAVGGVSMGAIVGAGLALEWDMNAMTAKCIDGFLRRPRLSDFGIPRASLFTGRKVRRLFDEWFGDTGIEETPVRYFCVSTNLSSGALSVHTSGRLADWVRASAAIPGVFPPVLDEGAVHVDGGVLDNLPTDAMRQLGVGSVIAVNVGSEDELVAKGKPPGILELLWRVGTIGSDSKVGSEYRRCDVLLTPKVQHVHLLDWHAYEQAVDAGYRAAVEHLSELDPIVN